MACVDGLKGFPEAIEAIYPQTEVQLCIVHLVAGFAEVCALKHRKVVAADLRRIYRAATAEEAQQNLEEVTRKWSAYPSVSQVWQRNWDRITPFFHYPCRDSQGDLYHQQRGGTASLVAQDHQNAGRVSQRGVSAENCCFWRSGRRPKSGPCQCKTGAKP